MKFIRFGEAAGQGMSPSCLPTCTAWVRRLTSNLSNNRLACVFTVLSLTNKAPRLRVLSPLATAENSSLAA